MRLKYKKIDYGTYKEDINKVWNDIIKLYVSVSFIGIDLVLTMIWIWVNNRVIFYDLII